MAAERKCLIFTLCLMMISFSLVAEARNNAGLNALLAVGLLSMLLKGSSGGHGSFSILSGLGHGNSHGHQAYGNSPNGFHGFSRPHFFGTLQQRPIIGGMNAHPLFHGLGHGLNFGMFNPMHPLHNAGGLKPIPHLKGLKQSKTFGVNAPVHSQLPIHSFLNPELFHNSDHHQLPGPHSIPTLPDVAGGNPFGVTGTSGNSMPHTGPIRNPIAELGFNENPSMPRQTNPSGPIENFENGYGFSVGKEDLGPVSEVERDHLWRQNSPVSPEQFHQYDPRSAADIPPENPVIPRQTNPAGPMEDIGNGYDFSRYKEHLEPVSEIKSDHSWKQSAPSRHDLIDQYDPRSAADIPTENQVPKSN